MNCDEEDDDELDVEADVDDVDDVEDDANMEVGGKRCSKLSSLFVVFNDEDIPCREEVSLLLSIPNPLLLPS